MKQPTLLDFVEVNQQLRQAMNVRNQWDVIIYDLKKKKNAIEAAFEAKVSKK